ncbi:MAG: hypothetical protein R3E96_12060 [Planctomycetota bacterium]
MQMENLLLLLLRMAAVGADRFRRRPPLRRRGALGALTENSQDFGSPSRRFGFHRVPRRRGDRVRPHCAARPDPGRRTATWPRRPRACCLLGKTTRLIAWPTPDKALSVLSTLDHPLDEPLALDAGLAELERLVEDGEILDLAQTEVRLLTDLQRNSFLPDLNSDQPPAWWERLDRLQAQGLTIHVEDLGPIGSTPQNCRSPTSRCSAPRAAPRKPGCACSTIRICPRLGHGQPGLDGNRLPSRRWTSSRAARRVIFPLGDLDSGAHRLDAALEGDRLAVDDHRAQVVNIPAPARIAGERIARRTHRTGRRGLPASPSKAARRSAIAFPRCVR